MTGTWRDTLFVWQGTATRARQQDDETTTKLEWKGTWVGCQDCPDARTAPTPNQAAFEASDMHFDVNGTGIEQQSLWIFDLTQGSGWDLGEGDEKKRHVDSKHVVLMKRLPWQHASEDEECQSAVVAVGENEFGSFISAGYLLPGDPPRMMLGRRYLDCGNEREKWTAQKLYERICQTDQGSKRMISHDLWSDSAVTWRIPPWRTIDLHAQTKSTRKGKRKRDGIKDDAETPPPLNIPYQDFSPEITIDTSGEFSILVSNVRWVEQWYGCGHEICDSTFACCKEVMEYTREERDCDVGWALYCGNACVVKYGAQAWAVASRQWRQDMYGSGYFLKSNGASNFWTAVHNDETASSALRDAGWNKSWIDHVLYAEAGDEPEYDDESP